MLQRLIQTAVFAGLIAGVFAWGAHMVKTTPLILAAEVYENAAPAAPHAPAGTAPAHAHVAAAPEAPAWEPAEGLERNLLTLLADLVAGVGFAFLLAGAMALSGRGVDAQRGMLWGLAGFASFFAAPALGLAPELPGMQAAGLGVRQGWWLLTAAATAGGLALIALQPRAAMKALGVALVALPHVVGAPQHPVASGALPAELAAQFAAVTLVVTGLFWLVLGGLTGYFYRRFEQA